MLTKIDLDQIRLLMREEIASMVKKEIVPIKKDISQLKKDLKSIVNVFDIEILDLRRRMMRVEKHLDLAS